VSTNRARMGDKPKAGELLVLILSNGMPFGDVAAVIDSLKNSSKGIGTHARRELYWQAYTKLSSKVSGMDGQAHCFLLYKASADGEGEVEIIDLTKRQRGLVNGGCEFVGLKLKPPEDSTAKTWCLVYSEDEAQKAWDDMMTAEPCIYITSDGVYAATRYKRALCKGLSGPLKTLKDVEACVAGLAGPRQASQEHIFCRQRSSFNHLLQLLPRRPFYPRPHAAGHHRTHCVYQHRRHLRLFSQAPLRAHGG